MTNPDGVDYFEMMSVPATLITLTVGALTLSGPVGYAAGIAVYGAPAGIAFTIDKIGHAIKRSGYKRMIKLVKQSQEFVNDPTMEPGRLLTNAHEAIIAKTDAHMEVLTLAQSFVSMNASGELCQEINSLQQLNKALESGTLVLD